jgi:hypothetical protein
MDIALFAFWWTQIAGKFTQRPVSETGADASFFIECGAFALVLLITLSAMWQLGHRRGAPAGTEQQTSRELPAI